MEKFVEGVDWHRDGDNVPIWAWGLLLIGAGMALLAGVALAILLAQPATSQRDRVPDGGVRPTPAVRYTPDANWTGVPA